MEKCRLLDSVSACSLGKFWTEIGPFDFLVTLEENLRGRYSCLERVAANSPGSVQLFGADGVSEL